MRLALYWYSSGIEIRTLGPGGGSRWIDHVAVTRTVLTTSPANPVDCVLSFEAPRMMPS